MRLKHFLYPPAIPLEVRIASLLWLVPTVFSLWALPQIITDDLGTVLLLYTTFLGISGLFISYGLSHLKRWSIYLFAAVMIILGGASIVFLIAFIFVLRHWKKFN